MECKSVFEAIRKEKETARASIVEAARKKEDEQLKKTSSKKTSSKDSTVHVQVKESLSDLKVKKLRECLSDTQKYFIRKFRL